MDNFVLPEYIFNLTYKLKKFNENKIRYPSEEIEKMFWSDIYLLLNDPNKKVILSKWEYGKLFVLTEKSHQNGNIMFTSRTWEQSFILNLLMLLFH
jgi:hypothetical protein